MKNKEAELKAFMEAVMACPDNPGYFYLHVAHRGHHPEQLVQRRSR